jgi:hypothetical protein
VATAVSSRLLSPSQIARLCPENHAGKSVSPTTVTRWVVEGVVLLSGGRLKLPATRYPAGWRIAEDDFRQFIAKLTADRTGRLSSPVTETAAEGAIGRLAAQGF